MRAGACRLAIAVIVCAACAAVGTAAASDFHVSLQGSATGDGSKAKPWDLATALAHPAAVKPGDMLWLHGGTYTGAFNAKLVGAQGQPITVRGAPGEWAVIDAKGDAGAALTVDGSWARYWGFEITNSDTTRWGVRGGGVTVNGPNTKLINLVIHDGGGNGFWTPAESFELYGCILYNQGYDLSDRGHGHAVYTQNKVGTKKIADNIIFGGYSYGVHAYTEGGSIEGFEIIGNVWFNSGVASTVSSHGNDCLVGGLQPADRVLLQENYGWANDVNVTSVRLGYSAEPNGSVKVVDNYLVGSLVFGAAWTTITMTGNTIVGKVTGVNLASYPGNTQLSTAPTTTKVVVRPNAYEPGRAHIVVYNWGKQSTVPADLSTVLSPGATYEIRNAQNVLAAPVLTGNYSGQPVALPMNGLSPAQPIGTPGQIKPADQTGSAFNVFLLTGQGGAPLPDGGVRKDSAPAKKDGGGAVDRPGLAEPRPAGDSAAGDVAASDSGSRPAAGGGCGCRLGGEDGGTVDLLLLLLVLGLSLGRGDAAREGQRSSAMRSS